MTWQARRSPRIPGKDSSDTAPEVGGGQRRCLHPHPRLPLHQEAWPAPVVATVPRPHALTAKPPHVELKSLGSRALGEVHCHAACPAGKALNRLAVSETLDSLLNVSDRPAVRKH